MGSPLFILFIVFFIQQSFVFECFAHKVTGFQLSANTSLSYQFKALEAVLQLNIPFKESIKNTNTPVWVNLGVRWRLMKKQWPANRIKGPGNGQ